MARASEWQRFEILRNLIDSAVEDATWDIDDEVYHYLIFISEGLDEVVCYVNQSDAEQLALIENYEGWNVETATNLEDINEIAGMYFDLR